MKPGTVVLAAAVVVTLRLLGSSQHNLIAGVAGVVFASLVWMPVTRRWSARAHVCWAPSRSPLGTSTTEPSSPAPWD